MKSPFKRRRIGAFAITDAPAMSALKRAAAQAAMDYILPKLHPDAIVGVGTGSTAAFFTDLLAPHKNRFRGTIASSQATADQLARLGVPVYDLNDVDEVAFYVDGADECTPRLHLIKGGGAALTREKIVAACAREFVCIADHSKWVEQLGAFPLPVEVIPMARAYVARQLVQLGGRPEYRQGVVTDNGNDILDVHGLRITDPLALEQAINQITGVVTNGLFAARPADVLLLSSEAGVRTLRAV